MLSEQEKVFYTMTNTKVSVILPSYNVAAYIRETLLSAAGQPLDWAQLAGQLYDYQNMDRVAAVRLRWGEDFYAALGRGTELDEEDK